MKAKLTIVFFFVFGVAVWAQSPAIDSLRKIIASSAPDTLKLHASTELVYEYIGVNIDTAILMGESVVQKYASNENKILVSDAYGALGQAYGFSRDFKNALKNFLLANQLLKKQNDKSALAKNYFNIGLAYYYTDDYKNAASNYIEAQKLLESLHDKRTLPTIYNGLGTIYKEMNSYEEGLRYFDKAIKMYTAAGDSVGLSSAINNIGNIYDYQGKFDLALANYKQSLDIKKQIGYERGMSSTLNNIGIILSKKGQGDEALGYYKEALSYSGPNEDRMSQAVSYDGIGMVYYNKKQYTTALSYLEKSISISSAIDSKLDLVSSYEKLALCYAATGNYKKAFDYQRLQSLTKDSILNAESNRMVSEMSAKYESEKKQLQINNLNKDNKLKQQELTEKQLEVDRQRLQVLLVGLALLLVSILAFFIFRGYKQKQKSNEIIALQRDEVQLQKDLLEIKNKEITDSINYAKRIQGVLLAGDSFLSKNLPEHFVLYRPKDIVSGDFYWANAIDDKFFLCTADCTGHGVPGAFMSLLNISFLNEAVNEKRILSPEKILGHVRQRVVSSLNPEGAQTTSNDGMDAVCCVFDLKGMWLRFACANNPLWIYRNGEMIEFAADKMPVGNHYGEQKEFNLHTVGLRKGDIVYTFTDGYADQFGGPNGKKFKYKNLQKLLIEHAALPMEEQRHKLENALMTWQGNMDQVDDILLIGVRF